jgi:hypothetical protein
MLLRTYDEGFFKKNKQKEKNYAKMTIDDDRCFIDKKLKKLPSTELKKFSNDINKITQRYSNINNFGRTFSCPFRIKIVEK